MADELHALINGRRYTGWQSVRVNRMIDSIADSFSLSAGGITPPDGKPVIPIHKGTPITLLVEDEVVLTGYINTIGGSDDGQRAGVSFAGTSCAGDLVRCATPFKKWKKQSPLAIAQAVCDPFAIAVNPNPVTLADALEPVDSFGVDDGERAMEAIARLARLRGLLVLSDPDGSLVMTRAGSVPSGESIVRGLNILSAEYSEDESSQFGEYVIKGQNAGRGADWHSEKAAHAIATVTDASVERYLPEVITSEVKATKKELERRARWERNTRAGRSISYRVTVEGWRGPVTGQLWRENTLVAVDDYWYGIKRPMLIAAVSYDRAAGSPETKTTLDLVLPQAYQPLVEPTEGGVTPW